MKNINEIENMKIEDILEEVCVCSTIVDLGDNDCGCKIILDIQNTPDVP